MSNRPKRKHPTMRKGLPMCPKCRDTWGVKTLPNGQLWHVDCGRVWGSMLLKDEDTETASD